MRAAVVVALVLAAAPARADDIALPRSKAILHLPGGWTKLDIPAVVVAYRSASGSTLAITRAQVPNFDAWRSKTRDGYVEQIEKGALAAVPGGKKLAKKLGEAPGGVPALDLEIRRPDGATLVMRVLLFRSYTLGLVIEVPGKSGKLDEARAITTTFAPPREPKP
ncbi:MAG TPA: hypothetical protein VFQ53_40305 [Kofleriaceae bacterium]|nr:hypothetical protein [Kofleriaceae bacterium]